ncbi:hypothetical protein E3T40_04050 [Cryobacterium sp. TMT1-19]|nr:hypothetical protein E3T40_04050 [Cryobacterium sp. TMT1-19]
MTFEKRTCWSTAGICRRKS